MVGVVDGNGELPEAYSSAAVPTAMLSMPLVKPFRIINCPSPVSMIRLLPDAVTPRLLKSDTPVMARVLLPLVSSMLDSAPVSLSFWIEPLARI